MLEVKEHASHKSILFEFNFMANHKLFFLHLRYVWNYFRDSYSMVIKMNQKVNMTVTPYWETLTHMKSLNRFNFIQFFFFCPTYDNNKTYNFYSVTPTQQHDRTVEIYFLPLFLFQFQQFPTILYSLPGNW